MWLIDPVDGTTNFSQGLTPFAMMIALLVDGETEAGWIYDPVQDRLCHAHHGHGAFVGDEKVRAEATDNRRPTAAPGMHFLPDGRRDEPEQRAAGSLEIAAIPRCAGEQYPRLANGQNDISLHEQRVWSWYHAPRSVVSGGSGRKNRVAGWYFVPANGQTTRIALGRHSAAMGLCCRYSLRTVKRRRHFQSTA